MAKISHQLLRSEVKSWGTIKRMFHRQTHSFGSYMNKRYHMQDTELAECPTSIAAIRILLEKHVVQ
jgi:hypothetical protein